MRREERFCFFWILWGFQFFVFLWRWGALLRLISNNLISEPQREERERKILIYFFIYFMYFSCLFLRYLKPSLIGYLPYLVRLKVHLFWIGLKLFSLLYKVYSPSSAAEFLSVLRSQMWDELDLDGLLSYTTRFVNIVVKCESLKLSRNVISHKLK